MASPCWVQARARASVARVRLAVFGAVTLAVSPGALAAPPVVAALGIGGETFAGEDVATAASDTDFNDVAVYYNRRCTYGAGGQLAGETIQLRAVAAGAAKHNALVLTLPGTPESATLYDAFEVPTSLPIEAGDRVTLFPDFRGAFAEPSGTFLNTTDGPLTEAPTWRLEIAYVDGQVQAPVACGAARFGIARPADGTFIDADVNLEGSNLPLVGSFPGSFAVPYEEVALSTAYPAVTTWLQGLLEGCVGACGQDWHLGPALGQTLGRGDLATTLPLPPLPTCDDDLFNAEEEDVDCGGACPACPTCSDGVQNGDEEDTDCGGTCAPCPTCFDGQQNGDEEGIDCGGLDCPVCETCSDGLWNQDEAWIDCGGSTCGTCPKIVFVTSTAHTGNLSGKSGANGICQGRANTAGLPGSYKAWIGGMLGGFSPSNQFAQASVPYVRVDGVQIADDWADLTDGTLDAAIDVTELGVQLVGGSGNVWTNVTASGAVDDVNDCTGWTMSMINGSVGSTSSTGSGWTNGGTSSCSGSKRLFCFQQ